MLRAFGVAVALLMAGSAQAATVTTAVGFSYAGAQVARATFTYNLLTPGQIVGLDDLTGFTLKIRGGGLFTLADLAGLDANRFVRIHFGTLEGHISAPIDPISGAGQAVVSATNAGLTDGFYAGGCGSACDNQAVIRNFRGDTATLYNNVAAVPEPSTWAMMLVGFGGIGAMLRRSATRRRPAYRGSLSSGS